MSDRDGVWIETIARGVHKVRWRENGKKPSRLVRGNLDQAERVAREIATRRAAESFTNADGFAQPLPVVLQRWRQVRLAAGAIQQGHAANVARVLTALFDRQSWRTTRDITQAAVDAWLASTNPKPRHVRHTLTYLRLLLRWAAGPAMRQPVAAITWSLPPKPKRERRLLTDEQLATIAERCAAHGQTPLLHCLRTYGWRPSTACKLTVGAVDLAGARIDLGVLKNKRRHAHVLTPETVELLRPLVEGRAADAPLFRTPTGKAWYLWHGTAIELSAWWIEHITYDFPPGAPRGIYDLKRYGATTMLVRTHGDVAAVQAITGHLRPDQLLTYLQTNEARQRLALGLEATPAKPPDQAAEQGAEQGAAAPAEPTRARRPAEGAKRGKRPDQVHPQPRIRRTAT